MIVRLERIAQNKLKYLESKHLNLIHHANVENLKGAYKRINGKKATSTDKASKDKHGKGLEANPNQLVARMRTFSYRPQPIKRVYIPRAGSNKLRSLGISSLKDELVQNIMTDVLSEIYESVLYDLSYGFRKDRDCHKAIGHLSEMIHRDKVNYIVDADTKGFFDDVNHKILMEFLRKEIGDDIFLRYIIRFLKAGTIEHGKKTESDKNILQGGLISPVLGNVYTYYALDMWPETVAEKYCQRFCGIVRYTDDFVCCSGYKAEAQEFFMKFQERLARSKLEIEVNKSKIIRFGRYAGEGKGTFDFLGFTFVSGTDREGKYRTIKSASKKKMSAKMKTVNEWIRANMHMPVNELIKKLNTKFIGYYWYYGITGNYDKLEMFRWYVIEELKVWLHRRSQGAKTT